MMQEGDRVAWKCEPGNAGTVDEVVGALFGEDPAYLVTFDDGQWGLFDRSELMETTR